MAPLKSVYILVAMKFNGNVYIHFWSINTGDMPNILPVFSLTPFC